VRLGCYYANRSNRFYQHLFETGFTPVVLSPTQFRELLSYGIGLDDVYDDPAALRHRPLAEAPRAVCFNSRDALARFTGLRTEDVKPPWRRGGGTTVRGIASRASLGDGRQFFQREFTPAEASG
jgi:hypothetical protein